jgi:hypothetical protein
MADRVAVAGAAAGTGGASYRRILTYLAKGIGNYNLNETNFAGLGQYLPCLAVVHVGTAAAGSKLQISADNGSTWLDLAALAAVGGIMVYLDTANTFRLVIAGNAADIRIFIQ